MAANQPVYPPLDGSLLLSDVVDFRAKHTPSSVIYVSATSDTDDTLIEVTALEFSRAVHRAAHLIRPIGSSIQSGQVVGILAVTDMLVYNTILMGALQAGLVPFPLWTGFSAEAAVALLKQTGTKHVIATSSGVGTSITEIQSIFPVEVIEVPKFTQLYPYFGHERKDSHFKPYPHHPRRPDDTMMYFHSSGSTNAPKPYSFTALSISLRGGLPLATKLMERKPPARLAAMATSPSHDLGFGMQVVIPLYTCRSAALFPSVFSNGLARSPLACTLSNVAKHIKLTRSTAMVVMPTNLQAWSKDESSVDVLKTLEWIGVSGGPLAKEAGDYLWSSGVKIRNCYGATQIGWVSLGLSDLVPADKLPDEETPHHWSYSCFDNATKRLWLPEGNNTFELVFLKCATHIPAVVNYRDGDKEGYATSDLFSPHPTVSDAWVFVCRKDDVIVHSSGFKTEPGPFENVLSGHPDIAGAVVFGDPGYISPGVLIELREPSQALQDNIRDRFWPVVSDTNALVPSYSRVPKDLIMFASPEKPLPRVRKGSVARKAALDLYKKEIAQLYASSAEHLTDFFD